MIVIGIDPGKKGGVCYSNLKNGTFEAIQMPESPKDLYDYLLTRTRDIDTEIYVENVHAMPGQGVTSMFNFGKGFGEILGVCAALDICVELVSPQKWKRAVLSGTEKDKAAAIEFVQREYPMINLVPGRCRVPQDGIADAVCIAHYGMLQELKK